MSTVIDRAEELRSEAIAILLAERGAIDEKLAALSYDGAPQTKKPLQKKKAHLIAGRAEGSAPSSSIEATDDRPGARTAGGGVE